MVCGREIEDVALCHEAVVGVALLRVRVGVRVAGVALLGVRVRVLVRVLGLVGAW